MSRTRINLYLNYHEKDPEHYPFFRFHPDPVTDLMFEKNADQICDCCGSFSALMYHGPFHTDLDEPDNICPVCIANGKGAEKYGYEYQDREMSDPVDDPDIVDELSLRTPGAFMWINACWRAHCNDYCAYIGAVDVEDLKDPEILKAVQEDLKEGETLEEAAEELCTSDILVWHLFQCLHCQKYFLYREYIID